MAVSFFKKMNRDWVTNSSLVTVEGSQSYYSSTDDVDVNQIKLDLKHGCKTTKGMSLRNRLDWQERSTE